MSSNFICYDGETINNKYILLGTHKDYIYNKKGLKTSECLKYLTLSQKKKRIIFNLHYDIQFWIRDLSDTKIIECLESKEIFWYNYKLIYFKNKMLIIEKGNSVFKIYDIITFFNKSLLNTIQELQIELTEREKYILELGKEKRENNFQGMKMKEIIEYNQTECIITNKIAGKIETLLNKSSVKDIKNKDQNLMIKNFYGSSAISSKILKSYKIDKLKKFDKYKEIFEASYYGGRFECLKLGYFKNIFKYDINSAYPSVMKDLKELKRFIEVKRIKKIMNEGIYYISFKLFYPSDFICPFPLRHKTGRIFFTGEIEGYYFGCEINSFINSGIAKENYYLKIHKGLIPVFSEKLIFENSKGYNVIEEMYYLRKVYKKKNDLRHYIYKIALNSMYGKLAQTVGSSQFQNLYYAGYITAKTRSLLYDASFTNDYENIIAFATDSILTTNKLKLKTSYDLGNWEFEEIKKAEVLLSGFYRLETEEGKFIYGVRGFKIQRNYFDNILMDIQHKGFSKISLNQFIGHKLALHSHLKYAKYRLQFQRIEKIINPLSGNFKRRYLMNGKFKTCNSNFHILDQKISSNKFKNNDLIPEIFVDF